MGMSSAALRLPNPNGRGLKRMITSMSMSMSMRLIMTMTIPHNVSKRPRPAADESEAAGVRSGSATQQASSCAVSAMQTHVQCTLRLALLARQRLRKCGK